MTEIKTHINNEKIEAKTALNELSVRAIKR